MHIKQQKMKFITEFVSNVEFLPLHVEHFCDHVENFCDHF